MSYEKRALCWGRVSPTAAYRVALSQGPLGPGEDCSRAPLEYHLDLNLILSGVLHVEQSNGKSSLFWRSSERERERERKGDRASGLGVHKAPIKPLDKACTAHKDTRHPQGELMSSGRKWAQWVFTFLDSRKRENNERERELEWERESERKRETWVPRPLPGFGTKSVMYSLGRGRKARETTSTEVGYLYLV